MNMKQIAIVLVTVLLLAMVGTAFGETVSINGSEYTTDANGIMAYRVNKNSIDIQSNHKDGKGWIQKTYSSYGFKYFENGLSNAQITIVPTISADGRDVLVTYRVHNTSSKDITGNLAVHADVQIANNDRAAIEVIRSGNTTTGLKMADDVTSGKQLSLYFSGTAGVTDVSTYWFGAYGDNKSAYYYEQIELGKHGSSYQSSYNSDYTKFEGTDSVVSFSWKNISVPANGTKEFSFKVNVIVSPTYVDPDKNDPVVNDPITYDPPKTGDNSNVILWSALACISVIGMMTLVRKRKEA